MPGFRIHRMKEGPRQQFRWAPHVSGVANVKPKDYEPAGETVAESDYAAWAELRRAGKAIAVGDILEVLPENDTAAGDAIIETRLRICKYVGFDDARWVIPDQPPVRGQSPRAGGDA